MNTETVLPDTCYALCAPDGPSTPFAPPFILWFDIFRIIVMLLGLTLIVWTPRLAIAAKAAGQRARLLGQGIFALVVVGTEVDHIGDAVHYRLFLSFVGVSVMLWGTRQLRNEIPPRPRLEHRNKE